MYLDENKWKRRVLTHIHIYNIHNASVLVSRTHCIQNATEILSICEFK